MPAQVPLGPQVRIRSLRQLTGLTAEQLAKRIAEHGVKVHPDHLRNCELGHQRASSRLLRAWALALGLDPLDVWMPSPAQPATDTVDAA